MYTRLLRVSPLIFFIIIGALIVSLSESLDVKTAQNLGGVLGPAAYPRLLGILMLILSGTFNFINWKDGSQEHVQQVSSENTQPRYLPAFLAFFGLLFLTYFLEILGFIIVSIALMLWFMFLMGERSWRFLIINSLIFPLVVYSVFRYGFNIVLPEGVLSFLLANN